MGILLLVSSIILWVFFVVGAFSDKKKGAGFSALGFFAVATTLGWLWLGRSAMQWFWLDLIYRNLTLWIVAIIFSVAIIAIRNSSFRIFLVAVSVIFSIAAAVWQPSLTNVYTFESLQYTKINSLPETAQIRYFPLDVAKRLGENQMQDSQYHLGNVEPIIYDGDFTWIFPQVPTGAWNVLTGHANGFAVIKSDGQLVHLPNRVKPDGKIEVLPQEMKYGEGMLFSDDLSWKLREAKYWSSITEIYYLLDREHNEVVALSPYISYFYRFPVLVPYWGGVLVAHSDGRIEDFTPEQAQGLPYTIGERVFPEKLTKIYVESWGYKYGISNAWFKHYDQPEIPTILHSSNQMPYLLPTSDGPKWFVATEPHGQSFGVFKIFLQDAHTGKMDVFELSKESALVGPNRSWEYAQGAFPEFKFGEGNMLMLEPRPVVKNGRLYWMVSMVPSGAGTVSKTVLVDAHDSKGNTQMTRSLSFDSRSSLLAALEKGLPREARVQEIVPNVSNSAPNINDIVNELVQIQQRLAAISEKIKELKK